MSGKESKDKYFTRSIFREMAHILNEIRLDFENEDERIPIYDKARLMTEIRNDLMDIFWNYELKTKRLKEKYDKHKDN